MPKMKTRKSAAKRYKITSKGKIKHLSGNVNHLKECKSPKSKAANKGFLEVHKTDQKKITKMLPYAF